tara:strand:- start:344 stop:565 length:222 start_codon:yes stop_codon:yes gene_type:complete
MSRNNVIIVAKIKNKYYVLQNLDMDTQFNENFIYNLAINHHSKFTRNRGKSLCIAHDIQKKIDTEYGVIEFEI